jgi:hypothetical protein
MGAVLAPLVLGAGASAQALAVASFGINAALYVGTSAVSYFISQPAAEASADPGRKLSVAMGGAVPQSIGVGRFITAGQISYAGVFARKSGRLTNYAVRQYILTDYPIDGGVGIWYAGRKCAVDWEDPFYINGNLVGYPITTFRRDDVDYKWVKFHDGRQTTPDAFLRDQFGSAEAHPYGANRIGYGRGIAVLTERYHKKKFTSLGEPRFIVDGMRCYDPRKDSTNGGSGSHRWNDPDTHEPTRNLAVIYGHIRRGITYDGERLFGGLNYPAYMLDNDSYFAAMNACDENVSLAGGGTEKRFAGGGEIDLSGRVSDVLDKLLAAMAGRVVETGGRSRLYVGGVGANVLSITDGDIVVTEPEDGEDGPDPDDIFNTVTGTYTSLEDAGETTAYRKKTNAAALARDGEELTRPLDLYFCQSNSQGQRVARQALEEGQRWIKRGIVLPPWARGLKPTDAIGWSGKKFIVGDVTPLRNGNVHVKLREANAADDDWSTDDEEEWDNGGYIDETLDPDDFTVTASPVSITDDDGTGRRPAIKVVPSAAVLDGETWADIKDEFENARALLFRVRKKLGAQKVIVPDGRLDAFFEDGEAEFTHNSFLPGLKVQIRTAVELAGGTVSDWSGWQDVELTNVRLRSDDLADGAVKTVNLDGSAVTTPKVGKGQISISGFNKGKKTHEFTNTAKQKGSDYVITTGAGDNKKNWAFEIDADGGAQLFMDVDFSFSVSYETNANTDDIKQSKNYAKGTLKLYRLDDAEGAKKIDIDKWTLDTRKKKPNSPMKINKKVKGIYMAGALLGTKGKARIYLTWDWEGRRQSGSVGKWSANVKEATIRISYNRR